VSHWARDLAIAAVALTAGYLIFSPSKPVQIAQVSTERTTPPPAAKRPASDPTHPAIMGAAVIAAMLVEESRSAYYASGRRCACPEDMMRNGRRCGGNSAYSRPGGAAPYCYVADVPLAMIQKHHARLSANIK
jgi:hypothetical protein